MGCAMSLSLHSVINEYVKYQENRVLSCEISKVYFNEIKRSMNKFSEGVLDKPLTELKYRDIEFLKNRLGVKYAPKTVNKWVYEVKTFLKWCVLMEYLEHTNMGNVKGVKSQRKDIKPFTLDEISRVLDSLKGHNETIYLLIATAFYTGMRPSELLAMRWENLCTETWSYRIDSAMVESVLKGTKTGSERIINLIKPLQSIFTKVGVKQEGFIFLNQYGKPYTTMHSICKYYWKPLLKELDIEYRPVHRCRHTYTVLSIQAGEDLNFISSQLGHTSLEMLIKHYGSYIQRFNPKRVLKIESLFTNYLQNNIVMC